MSTYLDEEFEPADGGFSGMWTDILLALDEADLQTLDRAIAREKFDALVDAKRTVRFRIASNPGGGMKGFTSIYTYVFPCMHLSCGCSCSE
jgi:hypothetical protein